jgi:hypothetical protein
MELCCVDPTTSPMSYLVSDGHRRKAARVVNAAILFHLVNAHSDSDTGASAIPPHVQHCTVYCACSVLHVLTTASFSMLVGNVNYKHTVGMGKGQGEAESAARDEVYLWRPWPVSVLGAPSFLERMMQQLCVVQGELGSAGGMPQGVEFTLQDAVDMLCEE